MSKLDKIVIIDGLAVLFRSFYAIRDMVNHKSQNIAGIYGFAKQILDITARIRPDYLAVALDMGEKTWRHGLSPEYKSNRPKSPPELSHQFAWIRDLCNACGIKYYEGIGHEADDYIASLVANHKNNANIYIVTYDKDLYQLIDDNVKVMNPFTGTIIASSDVYNKLGVYPHQVRDFLALAGDNADCISGAKGIGPKTAVNWLQKYGSLDEIIANADELTPAFRGCIIKNNSDSLCMAKKLVTLKDDLDIGDLSEARFGKTCAVKMKTFLEEIGLDPLTDRFSAIF